MANSSIHIQGGSGGSVTHNSRETFSYSVVFKDEHNELWNDSKEAFKIYRDELNIRSQAYTERTGQKLQKNVLTQLSAVVNLEQHHTLKDLEPIKKHLEKTFDTKVFQMSIHRDEGKLTNKQDENIKLVSGEDFFLNAKDNKLYFDKQFKKEINMEDWNIEKNYHAHIEFMGLDSLGNGIKRNYMNIRTLSNIQTFVAKDLNMQRGNQSVIIKENGEMERDFSNRKKRQDTHPFKQNKKVENDAYLKASKELLATKKDLQDANNQLRIFMKENGALRTDFAQLEQAKKELEEKLKAKELTIEEMESKFKEIEENFRREKGHLGSVVELKEIEIDDLRTKNYQIETFSDNLENQNKVLISQNEILEEKVLSLEEKIVPRANMSDYEAMKEDLKSVDENIETFENHFKLPKTGNLVKLMQWVETKFSEMKTQIKSLFQENQDLKEEIEFLKMRNEKLIDEKADLLMELGANDSNFKEEDHLEKLVKNLENRPKVKLK